MAEAGPVAFPLAASADAVLARLARATASPSIAALDGATLLGERAALGGFSVPGRVSAGGGCRLFDAADGTIVLNLARSSDRELLPALFGCVMAVGNDDAIVAKIRISGVADLVARGRAMGLAIAAINEQQPVPHAQVTTRLCKGTSRAAPSSRPPRVLDLSSLWAGPLCGHLLRLAGAEVVKVESISRPDAMRDDQTGFFTLLNQGKSSVTLDFAAPSARAALQQLITASDIVIEASRPRALLQLGFDADDIVRASPGLVWLTITAHGVTGEAADWVGFGDDVAVAAGLSAALQSATGRVGFVGDAIADPLTGIHAALAGWEGWVSGQGGRYGIGMRDVVAWSLADARVEDAAALNTTLKNWSKAEGQRITGRRRAVTESVPAFGSDTHRILAALPRC